MNSGLGILKEHVKRRIRETLLACAAGLLAFQGNAGQLSFEEGPTLPVATSPRAAVAGDFNNDGFLDLACVSQRESIVTIWYCNASGEYLESSSLPTGAADSIAITAGDFNGDSRLDLAVAHRPPSPLSVLLALPSGGFAPPVHYSGSGYAVVEGDFNHDSHLDLAVAESAGAFVRLGRGDGTFLPSQLAEFPGSLPYGMAAGDLNGDGNLDLALPNAFGTQVRLLLGDGNGVFPISASVECGVSPREVVMADMNLDGRWI